MCGAVSAAVWPSASNYRLYESLKMHQWCFDWHLTFPLPLLLVGEQQCHEWITYPHKTLSKKHTYLLHKKRCTESEYNFVLLMCIPVKNLFVSPIAHNSQFGSFHRQSIFHIPLNYKLCTFSIYLYYYMYTLIYIFHIFVYLHHIFIYSYILSNSSGPHLSSF